MMECTFIYVPKGNLNKHSIIAFLKNGRLNAMNILNVIYPEIMQLAHLTL